MSSSMGSWPLRFSFSGISSQVEGCLVGIFPHSFLIVGSVTYLYYLSQPVYVRDGLLLSLKLALAGTLVCLQIISVVLRSVSSHYSTDAATAVSELLAAAALIPLLRAEHRHAIRASAFLGLYLALGALFDGVESRSLFTRDLVWLGSVASATATTRIAILVLEEIPKIQWIIDPEIRNASIGEPTSGFWTRSFLFFLLPLFVKGYHTILDNDHLAPIGIEFSSKRLLASILLSWRSVNRTKRYSLFFACCWEYKLAILGVAIPRLCQIGFTFAEPFTIQRVIGVIEDNLIPTTGNLVTANFLAFAGSALCRAISTHMASRLVTRVRGGLVSLMLEQNLRLKPDDSRKNSVITHMVTVIDTIVTGLPLLIDAPFIILECGFGIYLLNRMVQQSCYIILAPFIFATGFGVFFGRYTSSSQKAWFQSAQSRVTSTSRMLSQLPGIKVFGLGPKAGEYLHHLRITELQKSKIYRRVQIVVVMAAYFTQALCPVLVVLAALLWGGLSTPLSPQQVYPLLALLTLIDYPISTIFRTCCISMNVFACFERIQAFLCTEEHKDTRVLLGRQPRSITRKWPTTGGASVIMTKEVIRVPSRAVRFENVSIAPIDSKTPILKEIDLIISSGSIVGVFGSTGSGKTTFLHSILGEVEILDGVLYVNDVPIAYVGQETYLPNMSLRDCVIGSCEYNEAWFRTVMRKCKLSEDINLLPGGENYMVGSGGVGLSGGQRQRVSIARAVYARQEIVILDDAFSALDRKTARAIINNLCGPEGVFRSSGTTAIIASYLPEVLDLASSVIFLDGSGYVHHESGTVSPHFRAHILSLLREENVTLAESESEVPEEDAESSQHSQITTSPSVYHVNDSMRQMGGASIYWFWIKAAGVLAFSAWLLLMVVMTVVDLLCFLFLRLWIANAPNSRYWLIGYALLPVVGLLFCGTSLFLVFTGVCPRASVELHREMAVAVVGSTIAFLSITDAGSLLNRFSIDMDLLTKVVPAALHNAVYQLGGSLSHLGIVLSGATYMFILLPLVFVVVFFLQRYYLRTSRQLRHLEIEAQSPLVTGVQESAAGLIYIRSFDWRAQTLDMNLHLLDEWQKPAYLLASANQLLTLVIFLLMSLLTLILSILTLYVSRGHTANSVGASFLTIVVLGERINVFILEWTKLDIAMGALDRVRTFLESTPREIDRLTSPLPYMWPSKGEVTVTNLTARYRLDETIQAPALRRISLTIPPGKKVGITGRTGSGKSSFLYALLGFLDYNGRIMIDGIDISSVPRDELRSRIITISQDQVELDGSIRDNLLPFDTQWDPRVLAIGGEGTVHDLAQEKVLRETLVRLRIWDKVEAKGGLKALLKDVGYSHGEKQLLCIARAVVRRRLTGHNLLLVDEATGSVDRWRDKVVREMMKEYFKGCTIIVVAHREESIADTNMRVTMSNGRMSEPAHR